MNNSIDKFSKVDFMSGWRRRLHSKEIALFSLQIDILIEQEVEKYKVMIKYLLEDGEYNKLSEQMKKEAKKLIEKK